MNMTIWKTDDLEEIQRLSLSAFESLAQLRRAGETLRDVLKEHGKLQEPPIKIDKDSLAISLSFLDTKIRAEPRPVGADKRIHALEYAFGSVQSDTPLTFLTLYLRADECLYGDAEGRLLLASLGDENLAAKLSAAVVDGALASSLLTSSTFLA